MIDTLIYMFLFALVIDGVKILIESFGETYSNKGSRDKDSVTVVLSAYNEQNILKTLQTLKKEANNFVIINDKSSDDTGEVLNSLGVIKSKEETEDGTLIELHDDGVIYKIHHNSSNLGKVPSIHLGLKYVNTAYTFICDADIYLHPEFEMPMSILDDKDNADAVAFCILPYKDYQKSIFKDILYKLQTHEYLKSMQIGRQFATKSNSVECISGAAGLFKTDRFKKLSRDHSNIWQGEDFERTLRELLSDGKVVYSENIVYTDAPLTLTSLTKQRVQGWWGGLYRNLKLMSKLMTKRSSPARLRFEMLYNLISLLFDPLKIIALWSLILTFNWKILLALYIVYVVFELFITIRIKSRTEDIEVKWTPSFLYPLYGLIQLHYRISGGIYMTYKMIRHFKNKAKLSTMVVLIALSGAFYNAAQSQDVLVSTEYSQYNLTNSDQWNHNYNLGVYVGNYHAIINYGLYDQINVGAYFKPAFMFDLGIRTKSITPTLIYDHWIGNSFIRLTGRYNYNNVDNILYPNATMFGLGFGEYSESQKLVVLNIDIYKQFAYKNPIIFSAKVKRQMLSNVIWSNSATINTDEHYSLATNLNVHGVYIAGEYNSNFEYTNQEYFKLGVGLTINF